MKRNSNCLEGMRCPQCGALEPFDIYGPCSVTVRDDGTETVQYVEWNDDYACSCPACEFDGLVQDFKIVNQRKRRMAAGKTVSR
jgi:hypothetical protein